MSSSEPHHRFRKIHDFFRSEIFILIVVVLVVLFLCVLVFCCIQRRRRAQRHLRQRLTEIVVIRSGSDSPNGRPKYTFRIKTDPDHATKLVRIIMAYPARAQAACALQRPRPSGHVAPRSGTLDPAGLHKWQRINRRMDCLSGRDSIECVSAPCILLTSEAPPLLSSQVQKMVTCQALKASQSEPAILLNSANWHMPFF